ncbi:hypothetical protein AB0K35_27585 [Micromonospora sp. NPDC053740]|uniref:hypothetical protein n=1 Tax=Micromonospora sp. NPDC053740 TaxID=3155173 RepID=UPI0034489395
MERELTERDERDIRATARRDFTREVCALLNFWEPTARDALASDEERDIYNDEVEAMVDKLGRCGSQVTHP